VEAVAWKHPGRRAAVVDGWKRHGPPEAGDEARAVLRVVEAGIVEAGLPVAVGLLVADTTDKPVFYSRH
jgi:hypothetical protein